MQQKFSFGVIGIWLVGISLLFIFTLAIISPNQPIHSPIGYFTTGSMGAGILFLILHIIWNKHETNL